MCGVFPHEQKCWEELSMKKVNWFSSKTKSGCAKLAAIFFAAILLFSFLGKLFQSDFGRIKVQHILVDFRGGVLDGQLYYPAGISSKDKLPAVVVAHGGGMNYGAMRGSAAEIARRGFVVLSLSAYGSSLSLLPPYDESGNGVEEFNLRGENGASAGILDAVDYVRSLAFVDTTRVGVLGQSMGSNRAGTAAVIDCGYFSFNDIMINVLYHEFGQQFTEQEICMDADALAAQRLNSDQLVYYNALREENLQHFDTRIKSVMVVGLNWLPPLSASAEVEVGGHTVTRNIQTNVAYGTGSLDVWRTLFADETIKSTWYSSEDVSVDAWYSINDVAKTNQIVGSFVNDSVVSNQELAAAIKMKTARLLCRPVKNVTHTGICLSVGLYKQQAKFFEQTLSYNNGELTSPATQIIDTNKSYGLAREICNGLSMLCMFGFVVALSGLLLKTELFADCVVPEAKGRAVWNKKRYWCTAAATFLFTFAVIYYVNEILNGFGLMKYLSSTLPFGQGTLLAYVFVFLLAGGTIVSLAVNSILNKKEFGDTGLASLNIGAGVKTVMKTLLLATTIVAAAYMTLMLIDYLFGQDYRYYTMYFSYVRPEYWFKLLPTILIFFAAYLIIGCGVNYTVRTDIPMWKDTLITVIIFSAGVWVPCITNEIYAMIVGSSAAVSTAATSWNNPEVTFMFCDFMNTYHFNITVPLVVFLSRVLYKKTNSIWLGAAVCAILMGWSCTGSGANDIYIPQTFLTALFG